MATQFIDDLHVSLVVGLGGYASVPMARAAARRNLPLVLLEQNAVAGRATRLLASAATAVCLSLPPARRRLRWSLPVQITGNPVRAAVVEAALHRTPSPARRLVVVGGSRGAGELNQHVPKALYKLREWLSGWEIVHQCGDRDLETTQTLYGKLALAARLEAFIDDLPTVLSAADLAICRAGGTTLAELAVLGVPAVLVPYAEAADDHQRHNALWFAEAGAAVVVERPVAGRRLDDSLAEAILPLVRQSELRASMAASISRRARPHAAHEIARLVESLLRPDQVADAA
jgi:UDP-N-acetylglucosamine--N-acetylmuramyl-(pentapeptide) pyrophosphoryl-undecaprenol N-acetylglucosamine transferase